MPILIISSNLSVINNLKKKMLQINGAMFLTQFVIYDPKIGNPLSLAMGRMSII
jgi:hypothetical protein